jgi:hypothetical protein
MANGNQWMIPVFALASLDRDARDRATQPLMLTMLPGAADQRAAVAAVAVTQQTQDGLRRERRVANQLVDVVTEAAAGSGTPVTRDDLSKRAILRSVATDDLARRINAVRSTAAKPAIEEIVAIAETAASDSTVVVDRDMLEQQPALSGLASDDLALRLNAIGRSSAKKVAGDAVSALEAVITAGGAKLPRADEDKYPELVSLLTTKQKNAVFV